VIRNLRLRKKATTNFNAPYNRTAANATSRINASDLFTRNVPSEIDELFELALLVASRLKAGICGPWAGENGAPFVNKRFVN
jgi:hypothetical protein